MDDYLVKIAGSIGELSALEKDWDGLLFKSPNATPFLSYSWLVKWWEIFAHDGFQLTLISIRKNDRLLALVPLYRRRLWAGPFKYREVRFIGTGEKEEEEIVSEYLDILYDLEHEEAIFALLVKIFSTNSLNTDLYNFSYLLEGSFISKVFDSLTASKKLGRQTHPIGYRYHIELPDSYESYLDSIPKRKKKDLLMRNRRVGKLGEIELVEVSRKEDLNKYIGILSDLHTDRWANKGEFGVFHNDRFRLFHQEIMAEYFEKGWLHLHFLTLNKEPIAALYNYEFQGTEYYYQSGMNMSGFKKISPGTLMLGNSIKLAIERGIKIYDLMHSGRENYKLDYASAKTPMFTSIYFSKTAVSRLVQLGTFILGKGRVLYNSKIVSDKAAT